MKKVIKLNIAAQMFNDVAFVSDYLLRHVKKVVDSECKYGWRGPIEVKQVFFEAEGFANDIKPLLVTFDYIPTPRIFRNTPKKKRKLINRYL
jgi:hypothetical protein